MFREMRRNKQLLSEEETIAILARRMNGVLAVTGDDQYPYAVPLSYVYADGKIYFHCARQGHKLDGIAANDKVSFCVIDKDENVPHEFTSYFRSVIVFGRARVLTADEEKRHALECIVSKYSPGLTEEGKREIEKGWKAVCTVEIEIEHMTGKEAIELVRGK